MKLALFPLPVFLLPGGKTQLRIFEPRYQRMVSESLKNQTGFGLCSFADVAQQQLMQAGTRVEIFDFDRFEDGTLSISIEGKDRFCIDNFTTDKDGLRQGKVTLLENWPPRKVSKEHQFVADSLAKLLRDHTLYQQQDLQQPLQDLTWVCQRWLELLPMPAQKKQNLFMQLKFEGLLQLIDDVLLQQNDLSH
ncbi:MULTISPECIES: LON peptidase substrate-binding domain-containing protein [unclassified Motilimonas]|uniref:LON peptidase substrate-binding domain-containing protein n=1 Tax=Motilimonas TaxID=1914248 RepID=UPI001E566D8C|nr:MULTISPECIES: LON peptidase substrate-binding domain-containing protein [unclassified Motilimonas]MCE0557750.1 LON peptidase substrate-binding domain-containing protein [Motilimonas sp. E26]MDO6525939.1 LON peptidase substrate-binding domain-containing protein [Motilimonas sp. 1_MG-2023]